MSRHWVDITAVGFFIIEWLGYAATLEHSAYGRDSLSARMNRYREVWVRRLLDRDARMVDMQIMASLQNGTAFFASTSLIAIGGALALLRATNDALIVLSKLPVDLSPSPALWEMKCVGLILIFIYTFFKFAWAYRLFNYVAILYGAMPPASNHETPEAEAHVIRTTRLFEAVRQSLGVVRLDGRSRDRHLAQAIRLQRLARNGKLGHKIIRREGEIEHLPFAIAIHRQHHVRLARHQRANRILFELERLH